MGSQTKRTWELWASDRGDSFHGRYHPVGPKFFVDLHLHREFPTVPVLVTEDPDHGTHWGFLRNEDEDQVPTMIFNNVVLLDMCFPGGLMEADHGNRGHSICLRVEPRIPSDDEV